MTIKDPWELGLMRESGRRLAQVSAVLREAIQPGMTANDLDALAESEIRKLGGIPSFLGYQGFPKTLCISPNEVIVHGIPDDRPFEDGDLLSVDMGLIYGGYHSDHAFTVAVGDVDEQLRQLLDVTERSLYEGIAQAVPGNRIGDIGAAVEASVRPHGFGIVEEYVGHGIGRALHEPPSIPNYGRSGKGPLLKAGMCVAIEPMITLGSHRTKTLRDGWTVVTVDRSLAAHFEHTVAITPKGPEVLTILGDA